MSPTTTAGPPAAGRPTAEPAPLPLDDAADPAVLLRGQRAAECELAEALARFQSEVRPAAEISLPAVVEAARGAFRLGFAYSVCRGLAEDGQPLLEVTLMHRGGDLLRSQVRLIPGDVEEEFREAARLLAQLLGIPVLSMLQQTQPSKAEEAKARDMQAEALEQVAASAAAPAVTVVAPASAAAAAGSAEASPSAEPSPAAGGSSGTGTGAADATATATEEALRPLEAAERELLVEMIRTLRPVEARRQFQIAFRHHFNVPREARSIAGFITQQRHKEFIDRFERELADLPPASAEAITSAAMAATAAVAGTAAVAAAEGA